MIRVKNRGHVLFHIAHYNFRAKAFCYDLVPDIHCHIAAHVDVCACPGLLSHISMLLTVIRNELG